MATVRVVTDSACDLPPDLAGQWGIGVVPVYLGYGDLSLRDGVEVLPEEVLARLAAGEFPKLSQPPPGDFLKAYQAIGYDPSGKPRPELGIVSIHVTAQLSGTYNSANLAAGMLPELDITVIDSRTGSMGTGFVVLEAARAARAGKGKDEIVRRAREALDQSAFFLVVPDLNFLYRAGRLGKVTAWLGHSLSLAPVICVRDGAVAPYRLARGYNQGLKALVSAALSWAGNGPVRAAVVHVGAPADADHVMSLAAHAFDLREAYIVHAGGAVTGALGPGVVGLCVAKVAGEEQAGAARAAGEGQGEGRQGQGR